MKLMEMQRAMATAVFRPLTPSSGMQRRAPGGGPMSRYAARFIKPNDRLTSFERLEIYNKQYWFRLLSSLMEDFPGLRAVLGERRFDAMAKAYLVDNPSQSFTLRDLGSRLEDWLRKHPRWAGRKHALAVDITRLEWADIEAFDGKAESALRPEEISGADAARLKLKLQPYIRLLSLRYPVDDLLLAVRKDDEDTDFASNAFQERRKRKRVRAVAQLKPAPIFLAVHRVDYMVYFRRLELEEFAILIALQEGRSIAAAIATGFRKSSASSEEKASAVQRWFQIWATLGWFCTTEKKSSKR
jgi:hypothetical protein